MKKRGICLLPDACYLSELNVPGKPNRTNLGECAAIGRLAEVLAAGDARR